MQQPLVLPQTVGELRDLVGVAVFDGIVKAAQAIDKPADTGRVQIGNPAFTYGRLLVQLCDQIAVLGLLLCQLYVGTTPDTDEYYWCVAPIVGHDHFTVPLCIEVGGYTEAIRELIGKLDQIECDPVMRTKLHAFLQDCLADSARQEDLPPPLMGKESFLKML